MLNFCDFIQVYVFSTNHHLKSWLAFDEPEIIFKVAGGRKYEKVFFFIIIRIVYLMSHWLESFQICIGILF